MSIPTEVLIETRDRFLFLSTPDFFLPLDTIELRPNGMILEEAKWVFQQNLSSAIQVGSIPFQLAHTAELDQRFGHLVAAERIRALKTVLPGEKPSAEAEMAAVEEARARMSSELAQSEVVERHATNTLASLRRHLSDAEFSASADELLRQVLVMGWGAFETLANDVVRRLLNAKPKLVRHLISERPYKDVLTSRSLLEALEASNFDLRGSVGDIVLDLLPLDGLEKIKSAMGATLRSNELDMALNEAAIWLIAQQRNLIVHRRGIVDTKYRSSTGDDRWAIGDMITFSAGNVYHDLEVMRDVGCLLLTAAVCELGKEP